MVEKLKNYRAELEAEKIAVETKDNSIEIETLVNEYRAKLVCEFEEKRTNESHRIASDIECLTRYITRLEDEAAAAIEAATINTVDFSSTSDAINSI